MPNPIKLGRKERMTFAKINEVCRNAEFDSRSRQIHMTGSLRKVFVKFLRIFHQSRIMQII